MIDKQNYYVPILKWKRGEQKALENLTNESLENLMPLLEIPPIDFDWVNNAPKKTIDAHIKNIPNTIFNSIGITNCFIDAFPIEEEDLLIDGTHSIKNLIENSLNLGCNVIPVTGINRTNEYNLAIKELLDNNTIDKICIRLEESTFNDINSIINSILATFNITPDKCHIVIDLKEIKNTSISTYQLLLPIIINNLINLDDWLSITLASTNFPVNLGEVQKNSSKLLPRNEYVLWENLHSKCNLNRTLQFGDYCIANPEYTEIDPRHISMSGNIRYTVNNNFLIYKGINARTNGFSQMLEICQYLLNSGYYSGEDFSWGDKYIYDCANGDASTGNAETWRRVGTNHHIEFVVDQLLQKNYFALALQV